MRIARARYPHRWWGRFVAVTASDDHFGFILNRYPRKIVGVAFYWRRRGVSWVWPIQIIRRGGAA